MYARISVFLAALALACTSVAVAQETTGTISGRIVDSQQLGVPGVVVTVTGPQASRSAVSDIAGRFTVPFLTPGVYSVKAELSGFRTFQQANVRVSLGQTVDLPIAMQVGGVNETVNVAADTPVIDTSSTTTGAVLSSDNLANIPVGRRVSDALYLAPGVSSSASAGSGNPSISGGSGLDNQYVIDGTNVTNQGYGALGSYSIVFGSLGNATPGDFVEEIQVKTGGYEAQYGQSIGGVVNVVTKTGSNTLRGSVFGYTRPTGLEGAWKQYQSANGTVQTLSSQENDFGAGAGGPIIRNHVFFYGSVDPNWQKRTFQAPEGFPLVNADGYTRNRRNLSYATKATFELGGGHRIDASFFGDPSHGDMGPQRVSSLLKSDTSSFSELSYGGHNQAVRYDGVYGANWLVEAGFARALNDINEVPSVNTWSVSDFTVSPTGRSGGIGFYEAGNHSLNNQYTAKATNIFGGHQIKYGVEFDAVTYSNINQRTGPTFTAPNGEQTATGAQISIIPDATFGQIYRVTRANFNSARITKQRYYDFFVQDSWQVSDRLTVNPGVRYEQEKLEGTLIKDFSLKNNWAPRIGVTYDPTGEGKAKVFANFGIFYARIPNDLAARALSSDDSFTRGDYFDGNLTNPIPDGTPTTDPTTGTTVTQHFLRQGVGADSIDPNAKLSYVREFVVGYEREIAPQTTLQVRWINRRIPRVLEDIANCPVAAYDLNAATAGACGSVEYILTNPTSATPINADLLAVDSADFGSVKFDSPVHKYDAIEVLLDRHFDRGYISSSYRWSRLRGNFEGFYREDNGQSDPGITALYDFPTNDPTYTSLGAALGYQGDIRYLGSSNGILPLDRPSQLKFQGNYALAGGLNLGANFFIQSGRPLTGLASNPNYQNQGEIPLTPRGGGFLTVDGMKTRTPVESQLDFQASYALRIGGRRQVTLVADLFNVFNTKTVLEYNDFADLGFGAGPNPDYGTPTSGNVAGPQFQTPFQLRIGAKVSF